MHFMINVGTLINLNLTKLQFLLKVSGMLYTKNMLF